MDETGDAERRSRALLACSVRRGLARTARMRPYVRRR
jgi:hypothetical protein